MDAFYVSVERRENPDLANKPVIVGADPKGGKGRGVVMASSYEARQIGIRSGMPIGMAWRKAPTATYLRPNYELYGAVSESVMNVLRSYADILEHVSIDEAFLDVTSKVRDFDGAAEYAARVKAAVREREGLACTIGAGPNKSIAKIASDLAKPDGLKVVRPDDRGTRALSWRQSEENARQELDLALGHRARVGGAPRGGASRSEIDQRRTNL